MKKIYAIILSALILFSVGTMSSSAAYIKPVDVGNFNDYGGGDYDWGGNDYNYDYGYDWGDDYNYDYYGYDDYDSNGNSSPIEWIIVAVIIIAMFGGSLSAIRYSRRHRTLSPQTSYTPPAEPKDFTDAITAEIKKHDENFSSEKFISLSKNLFVTLQNAWTERDWEKIRTLEKEELFEQHNTQLQEYIRTGKINVIERININQAFLHLYKRDNEYEYLTVYMAVRMKDYIINEQTKAVLQGDPNTEYHMKYMLTFIRKNGIKTNIINGVQASCCPNCGAPVNTASAGRCEYCGSVVKSGEFNWVLSDMEAIKGNYKVDNRGIVIDE